MSQMPLPGRSAGRIKSTSEQLAELIRAHVRAEGLRPGDRLGREQDLAARFGVSRPTLRGALRLLEAGNLIRSTKGPGGGIFVARTAEEGLSRTLSDSIEWLATTGGISLDQLLDAWAVLEVPVAGLAAERADEAILAELRAAYADLAGGVGDDPAMAAAGGRFHRALAAAADNPVVTAMMGWIFEVLQPRIAPALAEVIDHRRIVSQHRAILTAIERGSRARAERATRTHLEYLRELLT